MSTKLTNVIHSGRLLYPMLVTAAVGLILFSLVGIATVTGLIPSAGANRSEALPEKTAVAQAEHSPAAPVSAPMPDAAPAPAPAPAPCASCGVVESVRAIQSQGQSTGVGAVAGGVVGGLVGHMIGHGTGNVIATIGGAAGGAYAGNEIEKNTHKATRFQVRVRMDNGTMRTFYRSSQPEFVVGQKVRIEGSSILAQG